jgi:hypothetical protein
VRTLERFSVQRSVCEEGGKSRRLQNSMDSQPGSHCCPMGVGAQRIEAEPWSPREKEQLPFRSHLLCAALC